METRYRLGSAPCGGGRRAGVLQPLVRVAWCLVMSGLLAACQTPAGGMKLASMGAAAEGSDAPGKLAVIVNLAADDGTGAADSADGDAIAAVTARVMERLEAAMPPEDFAAVRTFNLFPAIAFTADGELIARILAMPEVVSVERDQELQLQAPQSDLRFK